MSSIAPAFFRAAAMQRQSPAADPWVRDSRWLYPLGLLAWLLLALMTVPEDFDYSGLATATAEPAAGGPVSRLLWLGLLGASVLILAWRRALAWRLLRWLNPWLPLFALLAAASVLWSIDPEVTARRMIRVATFLGVACALVLSGWHAQRFQNVVRPMVTLLLLGSLAFGLADPQLAIHQDASPELAGAWRGLTNHKNSLGALSCLGLILWAHAWLAGETGRWSALAGFAAAGACLVLSRSSSALMAAVPALSLLLLLQRPPAALRRYLPWLVVALVAGIVLYTLTALRVLPGISLLLGPIASLTGKSLGMTGRAEIWDVVSEHIRLHPWLGSGYGAYWTGPVPGSASYAFVEQLAFYPGSAHNGYLEVVNDLGLAGGLCLGAYLATCIAQCLRLLRVEASQAALYLALFVQEAALNLSESHWFSALSLNFAVMTLVTVALARSLLQQELRREFGEPGTPLPQAQHG